MIGDEEDGQVTQMSAHNLAGQAETDAETAFSCCVEWHEHPLRKISHDHKAVVGDPNGGGSSHPKGNRCHAGRSEDHSVTTGTRQIEEASVDQAIDVTWQTEPSRAYSIRVRVSPSCLC